jgi:hypothetical protein
VGAESVAELVARKAGIPSTKPPTKERDIFLTASISLPIPELTSEDAPMVFRAEVEYDK